MRATFLSGAFLRSYDLDLSLRIYSLSVDLSVLRADENGIG